MIQVLYGKDELKYCSSVCFHNAVKYAWSRCVTSAVRERVETGDKVYTDNDRLESLLLIFMKCKVAYKVYTQDIAGKSVHEVPIT